MSLRGTCAQHAGHSTRCSSSSESITTTSGELWEAAGAVFEVAATLVSICLRFTRSNASLMLGAVGSGAFVVFWLAVRFCP
jgi:hypothetical protein